MLQNSLSGGSVKLIINKKVIGFATGITVNRTQNVKAIYEIDNPFAVELAPTFYAVSGTLQGVRLRGNGGVDGSGILDLSTTKQFFAQKYVTIEVVDRLTNQTLYTVKKCLFDSDSFQIQAKSLVTFSANFRGTFIANEISTD